MITQQVERIKPTGNDMVVIASNPQEMIESQKTLIVRMKQNADDALAEQEQHELAVSEAKKAKINPRPLERLRRIAARRVLYYTKMVAALEAGYAIVPNFPGDTIAIRVKRSSPEQAPQQQRLVTYVATHRQAMLVEESADILPVGQGRYVSPVPESKVRKFDKAEADGKTTANVRRTPTTLTDTLGLPVEYLKPEIIQRTSHAAMLRIFDELAISPGSSGIGSDPMILGRIRAERDFRSRQVTFLIAWFIDPETL